MASWAWGAVVLAVVGFVVGVGLAQGLLELSPRGAGVEWAPAWALSASARVSWDWEAAGLGPLSWEFRAPVLLVWLHNPTGKWAQVALLAEYPPQAAPPLPLGSLGTTESQLLSLLTTWEPRILYSRGNATLATTPTPTQLLPPGTRVALLSPGATVLLEIPLHWGAPEKLHLCTPDDCTQLPLAPATTPPTPPQPQPWTPINTTDPDRITVFKYVERVYIVVDRHGGPQGMLVPHPNALDAFIFVDEDAPGPCDPAGPAYRYVAMGSTLSDPRPIRATCGGPDVKGAFFGEFTLPVAEKTEYSNGTIVYRSLTSNVTWGAVYWPDPTTSPAGDAGLLLETSVARGGLAWVVGTPAFTYAEDNVITPPTGSPNARLKSIPNLAAQGLYPCMSREYTLVVEVEFRKDVYENGRLKAENQPATLGEMVDAWEGRDGAAAYLHLQALAHASSFFHTGKTATWVRYHNLTLVTITYSSEGEVFYPVHIEGGASALPPSLSGDVWATRFTVASNTNDPASIPLPRDARVLRIALTYTIEAPRPPDAWQARAVPFLQASVWGGANCPYTYPVTATPGGVPIAAEGLHPKYQGYSPPPPPTYAATILALITE